MSETRIDEANVALAQGGDDGAKARLLSEVEPLIAWWLKRVRWAGDFEDGLQEGRLGVLQALGRFDSSRGAKFSTFAGFWIRRAVETAMRRSPSPVETLPDEGGGEREAEDALDAKGVRDALSLLSAADQDLLRRRFVEDESLEQIGKALGIHKFSASLRIEDALDRLRGAMRGVK